VSEAPQRPELPQRPNSEEDLAAWAQVDSEFVGRLVDLGIVRPTRAGFTAGDVWRVRVLRSVEGAGVSMEALASASETLDFDLSFLDTLLPDPSPPSGRTFGELAAELGDQGTLVGPVSEMLGLGAPLSEAPTLAQDDAMLSAFARQWGADPDIALRAGRLLGQTVQRFAEGWAGLHYELYRTLLGPDRLAWSPTEHAREGIAAQAAVRLAMSMLPWLLLHHVERLLAADVVENVLTSVGPFAVRVQDPEAGARLPAVAFVDISGYTALTESAGNEAAARATSRFETVVTAATAAEGGRVVKLLGDGALLLFPNADAGASAIRAVNAIRTDLTAEGLHPHAGIDQGPVVERDGDIFGRTVNLASRLASFATAGQIVVSEAAAAGLTGPGSPTDGLLLEPLGDVTLKGIDRPIRAFGVG
jgi:adenylate cyclase